MGDNLDPSSMKLAKFATFEILENSFLVVVKTVKQNNHDVTVVLISNSRRETDQPKT